MMFRSASKVFILILAVAAKVKADCDAEPLARCNGSIEVEAGSGRTIVAGDVDNESTPTVDPTFLTGTGMILDAGCLVTLETQGTDTGFTCFVVGVQYDIKLIASNSIGQTDCDSKITVVDTTPPMPVCTPDVSVELDENGEGRITPLDVGGSSTDNCQVDLDTLALSDTFFTCANLFVANTVTLSVRDTSGNLGSAPCDIPVVDMMKPNAICQDAVTVTLDNQQGAGTVTIDPSILNNGSTDNCGTSGLTFSADQTVFTCANLRTNLNPVTLTVTDQSSNFDTCNARVLVQDVDPPVPICQDVTVQLDGNGIGSTTPAAVDGGSTDNCAVDSNGLNLSNDSFTCENLTNLPFVNTVTLTVPDTSGNVDQCNAEVTVVDFIPPVAQCQDIVVKLDDNGQASIRPEDVDGGSTDNCETVTFSFEGTRQTNPSFDINDIGIINTFTLTVTDTSGNTDTCTANVEVISPCDDDELYCFNTNNQRGGRVLRRNSNIKHMFSNDKNQLRASLNADESVTTRRRAADYDFCGKDPLVPGGTCESFEDRFECDSRSDRRSSGKGSESTFSRHLGRNRRNRNASGKGSSGDGNSKSGKGSSNGSKGGKGSDCCVGPGGDCSTVFDCCLESCVANTSSGSDYVTCAASGVCECVIPQIN